MAYVSRRGRRAVVMLLLGSLLLGGVRASQAVVARSATPDPVTLRLWPAGQGRIDVMQDGTPVGSCDFLYVIDNQGPCRVLVAAGTPVTVTASPEPGAQLPDPVEQDALPDFPVPHPSFVRWTPVRVRRDRSLHLHSRWRPRLGRRGLHPAAARGRPR